VNCGRGTAVVIKPCKKRKASIKIWRREMKNLHKFITAAALSTVLMMGTTFSYGGIIVAGAKSDEPCKETTKVDSGIIVAGATGIIVAGLTGIIVAGFTGIIVAGATETPVDCGIIVAG
jgi:hypothetical protein